MLLVELKFETVEVMTAHIKEVSALQTASMTQHFTRGNICGICSQSGVKRDARIKGYLNTEALNYPMKGSSLVTLGIAALSAQMQFECSQLQRLH